MTGREMHQKCGTTPSLTARVQNETGNVMLDEAHAPTDNNVPSFVHQTYLAVIECFQLANNRLEGAVNAYLTLRLLEERGNLLRKLLLNTG
ncbi:MAG: hypothetical protein K0Q73_8121 [Paenibacillus sp.]|nr:hypothetical protein [Paenibacillus sp.]